MYCASCGTLRVAGAKFCAGCGTQFPEAINESPERDAPSSEVKQEGDNLEAPDVHSPVPDPSPVERPTVADDVDPTPAAAEDDVAQEEISENVESDGQEVPAAAEDDVAEEETSEDVEPAHETPITTGPKGPPPPRITETPPEDSQEKTSENVESNGQEVPASAEAEDAVKVGTDGSSWIQEPDAAPQNKPGISKQMLIVASVAILAGILLLLLSGGGGQLLSPDRDGDGVSDSEDAFPDNYNEQYDSDYDGVGDNGDNCPYTGNINQRDTDSDGEGDDCDSDDDGDGVSDYYDDCPLGTKYGTDTDGDGCKNTEDSDDDDDGLEDWNDECPSGEANWYSTSTTDFDGDGCQDSSEDSDDDNDGYSDYQDWYDRGDGGIKLELTRFTAWSGGYYDGDDSNPDVYAYIGIDTTCSDGDPDWYYYEYSVHSNSYDLSDWLETNWNIAETATTICIIIEIWDDDAFDDDKLDYVEGSGTAYYYTFDLDEGEGVLSREFDNRGENDVSILLHFEFSIVYYS